MTCQKMVYAEGRICDKPATHAYYGLLGTMQLYRNYAKSHTKRWGSSSLRNIRIEQEQSSHTR